MLSNRVLSLIVLCLLSGMVSAEVAKTMQEHGIVPDIIDVAPEWPINVSEDGLSEVRSLMEIRFVSRRSPIRAELK